MSLSRSILAAALLAATASAQPATKQIGIRDTTVAPTLTLTVRQTKPTYRVNEPIRLRAKVDHAAYVYVYTRDDDGKYLTLLYPARPTDKNRLPANKWTVVPPRQEFFGDAPGAEKIVVVASERPIDLTTRYFTEEGKFLRTSSESMTAAFADKSIRLRDETPTAAVDPAQKVVKVRIVR